MRAFLLTWNPDTSSTAGDYGEIREATARGESVESRWSVNRKGGISQGDRAWLVRQHDNRGLVAIGEFTDDEIVEDDHWDGTLGKSARYAYVRWDQWLPTDERIPIEELRAQVPGVPWDYLLASGNEVPPNSVADLEQLWGFHLGGLTAAELDPTTRAETIYTDDGNQLDATFTLDGSNTAWSLTWHARGGAKGTESALNTDYQPALELLLRRLATRQAQIDRISVDSKRARRLPEPERRLDLGFPIRLSSATDTDRLRRDIGQAQSAVARRPGARGRGNPTKRLRLEITLPEPFERHVLLSVLVHQPAGQETDQPQPVGGPALVISVGTDTTSQTNLDFGLDTGTWGFPRHKDWYDEVDTGTLVVFGTDYSHPDNNSPRKKSDAYQQGRIGRVVVARATGPIQPSTAPHWPNETEEDRLIYIDRFPLTPLFELDDLELSHADDDFCDAFRLSAINQGEGRLIDLMTEMLTALVDQAGLTGETRRLTFASSPGLAPAPDTSGTRPGHTRRTTDAAANEAVEDYAVELATDLYTGDGWTVTPLGKPYDLHLARGGVEHHVEVKGTTGAGATVNLTTNEVRHAHEHPTDLIVVTDICLDRTTSPPTPSGGRLSHHPNWRPAEADLRVTQYEYRVPPLP